MATTGDEANSYQSGGSGGKFRKRRIQRNAQATPYDRPITAIRNNQPNLFAKLLVPASKLIYAGADRLFNVFRKRFSSIPVECLPETSEEPRNGSQEAGPNSTSKTGIELREPSTDEGGNMASISEETEISEFESMLKQKTFTRSEIERLTMLLHSRTTESVVEVDRAKLPVTTSQVLRLEASTSGILNENLEDRGISTPTFNSRVFEHDVATPAELARAYMGTSSAKLLPLALRPSSQPPRQDSLLTNNITILPKAPVSSLSSKTAATFKTFENDLSIPRSQGRSPVYNVTHIPYYRGPSTLSQKGVASPSAWEHGGSIGSSRMGAKHRSSVIDDTVFGGPMRRVRQKANLLSQQSYLSNHRSEFGSSQKLLLRNEPEPKSSTQLDENMETGEIKKPVTSDGPLLAHNDVSTDARNKIFQTPALPEVDKVSGIAETSDVNNQKMGFNFSSATSPSNNTWSSLIPQSTSIQKEPAVSQRFGKSIDIVGPSGVKSNIISEAKPFGSARLIHSGLNTSQVKFSASTKDDNDNTQKPVNLFGKSESSSASHVFSSATTASSASTLPSSVPAPIFTFGSASASSPSSSLAPTKPSASTSSTTSSNGGGIFAFSSPSATLTTNGFQANTKASSTVVTQAVPSTTSGTAALQPPQSSASAQGSGITPGLMFGLGTMTTPSTTPFQFGDQTSQQPPSQNPVQTSGGSFNVGGSFSLRSGESDKSGCES
ncbi:hypothetical protein QVD17_36255 [Tagetes erecta]|uniref:Nuclear pore complex protein NUP1-like n=1 Tax=Tagetes erecta TaxID=13708 RepID=A0AAD8NIU9_TARER|nr:hypothetical protein QVD17_36255 [Tagetes erecta]